jgi:hypothetical protein
MARDALAMTVLAFCAAAPADMAAASNALAASFLHMDSSDTDDVDARLESGSDGFALHLSIT